MTPEPMSDERWEEINNTTTMYGNDALSEEDFNAVLDEIRRLKAARAIPPDVQAAMERYRAKPPLLSSDEWWQERRAAGELIARHFVSHFGKDGA